MWIFDALETALIWAVAIVATPVVVAVDVVEKVIDEVLD